MAAWRPAIRRTAPLTWGRNDSRSAMESGAKNRRRITSATSSFWTGCTPSSCCRPKICAISPLTDFPKTSAFSGPEASSEATTAQRSTRAAAWQRYWKKSTSRTRSRSESAARSRAYISTSSISTSVERPSWSGRANRSESSDSAGGGSRSSSAPSPWIVRSPSAPANWKARTLHGWRSLRVSPPGPRTTMPFWTSSLSKLSATTRARGNRPSVASRNCSTAGSEGSCAGSWNRWRSVMSVCVLPPP